MLEKLEKAKWQELYAWMVGAFIFGLGAGAYIASYIQQYALWIMLLGLIIHMPAMYKIYTRK